MQTAPSRTERILTGMYLLTFGVTAFETGVATTPTEAARVALVLTGFANIVYWIIRGRDPRSVYQA